MEYLKSVIDTLVSVDYINVLNDFFLFLFIAVIIQSVQVTFFRAAMSIRKGEIEENLIGNFTVVSILLAIYYIYAQ
jgi:hypothetical protein